MTAFTHKAIPIAMAVIAVLLSSGMVVAAAPKVAKAEPDNAQQQVDPALRQIRIEFDQPMDTRGHSIVGGGESFPRLVGKPRWENERTLLIPIKLEPDHDYWLSINSETFTNFRGRSGEIAEPYPIAFRTAAGNTVAVGPARLSKDDNQRAFEELRSAILQEYAYRDRMKIDWASALETARPRLEAATTPIQFARQAAAVLAPAKDLHLWLKVDQQIVPTTSRRVSPNCSVAALGMKVPQWKRLAPGIYVGRYPDGIGYMFIDSWSSDRADGVRAAIGFLKELDDGAGLVIDVRANAGGSEPLAQELAGCFIDKPAVYAKHRTIHAGEFSEVQQRVLEPHAGGVRYRGKIAVLMGPANMSSCESFLQMMKQVPGCTLIGEKSWGSSGNPQEIDLGNGVIIFVPSWQDLHLDGSLLEGHGVEPDIRVPATGSFAADDPVLEAGLKALRGG